MESDPVSSNANELPSKPFSSGAYARELLSLHVTSISKGVNNAALESIKVGIVGAGIAGLYAGFILKKLDIPFEIIEANDCIGGRIWTHYFSGFRDEPGTPEYYDYFDIGAMRFPLIQNADVMGRLLGKLVDSTYQFGLIDQLNSERDESTPPIKFERYVLSHDNTLVQYNGITLSRKELRNRLQHDKDPFHFGKDLGGDVPQEEILKGSDSLLREVYQEFIDGFLRNFKEGFQKLVEFDKYSVRGYMRDCKKYSETTITWLETLNTATGLFEEAFTESVLDAFDFSSDDWVCIAGGASRIVHLLEKNLLSGVDEAKRSDIIQKKKKVTKVSPSGAQGMEVVVVVDDKGNSETKSYSHVILTPTLPALRTMDLSKCHLSFRKRTGLRTLHYDSSVKVALRFKSRWWQVMKGNEILGGTSVTDSPIRTIVYPSYGNGEESGIEKPNELPGILIVSYTWAQDADLIGSLDESKLVELCLKCLEDLHGPQVREQFTGECKVHSWQNDPLMNGAFALYGPTQFQNLYASLVASELNGRLHIAGEAASVHHAWIIGSLNSAYRAVWNILENTPCLESKRKDMYLKFGKIDEIDYTSFLEKYPDVKPLHEPAQMNECPRKTLSPFNKHV